MTITFFKCPCCSYEMRVTDEPEMDFLKADNERLKQQVEELREALKAITDFDELPLSEKRPDIFQLLLIDARQALESTED